MNKPSSTIGAECLKVGLVFDDSLDRVDGVSQYVRAAGAWLASHGHEVHYLVGETAMLSWAGGKVHSLSRNFKVSANRNRVATPLPADRRRIKELLDSERFDVLHVQMPYSPWMAHRVIKLASPTTAVVGTFHILPAGHVISFGSKVLRGVVRRSLKRFDKFLAVSPAAAAFARKSFGRSFSVLPNMVDMARFKATPTPMSASPTRIIFLGRLVPRKGALELLRAFNLLHQKLPQANLIIGGSGAELPALKRFVAKHKLGSSVKFLGYIEEADKASLLASADIACFPSTGAESFGIVLIEAMAAGAGVVLGGDNPGYRSVLGDQPKLLIEPRDSRQFAERLEELLTNKALATKLHIWQLEHVKQYDVNQVMPQLLEVYHQAIAKRRSSKA